MDMVFTNSKRFRHAAASSAAAVIFTALAISSAGPWAAAEAQTASSAAASDRTETSLRKNKNDRGITAHGFVRDSNGVFTTVDVPGATTFTLVLGTNEAGKSVGAYVDRKGQLRGFLRDSRGRVTRIDFPGARATATWKINATGQMVGAYAETPGTPFLDLEHGFLLDLNRHAFTRIDVPGAVRTQAHAINNRGQIVGEYLDRAGKYHGFLLDSGVFTTIDAPGGTSTKAFDIDDSGRIVGASLNASILANVGNTDSPVRGFLRDAKGAFTSIEAPGMTQTQAFGINNAGQIVGITQDAQAELHGFLLDHGEFTTIDADEPLRNTLVADIDDGGRITGGSDFVTHGVLRTRSGRFVTIDHPDAVLITNPLGINNRGAIVGYYEDATRADHAYLRDRHGSTTIDIPGALGSQAWKINDAGQIVGHYSTADPSVLFPARGFLWERGVVVPIDVPGALHTQPQDIDNSGRIVGEYQDAAGAFHGFLRDPSGVVSNIDVPGALATSVLGINDDGDMVGFFIDADGSARSFLRDAGGAFTTLVVPGATLTNARDINNAGEIVGSFVDEAVVRGFILRNGRYAAIDVPDNPLGTHASGINDFGWIVGTRD
jgi:probable HAF family extracellular repeat protein